MLAKSRLRAFTSLPLSIKIGLIPSSKQRNAANSIDKVRSRMVLFTITFEG